VPFDDNRATIHNELGRVTEPTGDACIGVYTAGWIKRGPSGVIGTNKRCAQETCELLLADLRSGALSREVSSRDALLGLLRDRGVDVADYDAWRRVDTHELEVGAAQGRPRVKLVRHEDLLARAGEPHADH
jgi:ferredoxin--NADP+ reductase